MEHSTSESTRDREESKGQSSLGNTVISITCGVVGPPDRAPIPEGDRYVCGREGVLEEVTTKDSDCGFSMREQTWPH